MLSCKLRRGWMHYSPWWVLWGLWSRSALCGTETRTRSCTRKYSVSGTYGVCSSRNAQIWNRLKTCTWIQEHVFWKSNELLEVGRTWESIGIGLGRARGHGTLTSTLARNLLKSLATASQTMGHLKGWIFADGAVVCHPSSRDGKREPSTLSPTFLAAAKILLAFDFTARGSLEDTNSSWSSAFSWSTVPVLSNWTLLMVKIARPKVFFMLTEGLSLLLSSISCCFLINPIISRIIIWSSSNHDVSKKIMILVVQHQLCSMFNSTPDSILLPSNQPTVFPTTTAVSFVNNHPYLFLATY